MNTKTIAIAMVLIVVIAGLAVSIPQLSEEKDVVDEGDARLLIYGNANQDDYLDDRDVKFLEQVIAEKNEKNNFCDANQDGNVDQADVDFVKKMVDREPMQIYYLNTLSGKADPVDYPITKVITIMDESLLAVKVLGKINNVVGYTKFMDNTLFSDTPKDATAFKGNKEVPIESISQLGAETLVALANINYVTNEEQIEDAGITVVRMDLRDTDSAPSYLTLGYLMDAEERTYKFVKMIDDTVNTINDKVNSNVKQEDKIRGMVIQTNVINGLQSDYGPMIEMAGGINAVDWYEHRFCSDGYDWLYEYDFDFIVGRSPGGYGYGMGDADDTAKQTKMYKDNWDKRIDRYKLTDAIINNHMVIVDQAMPTFVMAAYIVSEFYPDLFDDQFGVDVHQNYLNEFLDNLSSENYDVSKQGMFKVDPETAATF